MLPLALGGASEKLTAQLGGERMEFLLIAVLIGLIPAAIASGKGRNFFLWWIYGAALWIVAMPHSMLLKPDRRELEQRELAMGDTRKCPHCAEIIKSEAKVCRFCGRDVEPIPNPVTAQGYMG
jgi:hypothetical protein